jgi:fkbH domain
MVEFEELKALEYPFNWKILNRKKKKIKKMILSEKKSFLEKKIAILGGSTTSEIKNTIEVFLLKEGIKPIFYESEYNKYYEDALFSEELIKFNPEIIYIHTNIRNIDNFASIGFSEEENKKRLHIEKEKFKKIWENLFSKFSCVIIQNNFENPQCRFIGNSSAYLDGGKVNFINKLNMYFSESTKKYKKLYINDIQYISSLIGLENWYDNSLWFNYKYAMSFKGMAYLSHSVSSIVKSIYGKNKKVIALDLDNTLWGGVIGDDGVSGIKIGKETAIGEAYDDFQYYLKSLKNIGILLTINSKNDLKNAMEGLEHPSMVLKKDDFSSIKANWNPKPNNIIDSAKEINVGVDSFVFIDDNPVERDIVKKQLNNVEVPDIGGKIELYKDFIDRNGYFEILSISEEDLKRNKYYEDNQTREKERINFEDYTEYLKSLNMIAEIQEAKDIYLERIYQLINKTNQFNLTTKRYTEAEVEEVFKNNKKIILYGRLKDKFGDNGLVSVIIGELKEKTFEIPLWIMSCRVLKKDMEKAMMDKIIEIAKEKEIEKIIGEYIPSAKNKMVENHYRDLGFKKLSIPDKSIWELEVKNYVNKNKIIKIGEY